MKSYIKNLEFGIFSNHGDRFVTVDYDRNGEHSHYTLSGVPDWVRDEKSVRRYINRLAA